MTTPSRRRGRPLKAHASFSQTREDLIRVGMAILTEKGFLAAGLDEILSAVNVPKGSFYHYFESKERFGAVLIERYAAYFAGRIDRFLLNAECSPLERLKEFTRDAERGMARHGFRRGCLVGNLGQEMGALPDGYRRQLSSVFKDWEARTAKCLEGAKDAGEIAVDADCKQLATLFWIGWEGAVLRAKLEQSAKPLRIFADGFFAVVQK
ncbi:TetR/AcrR family transcriptional regulator [Hyphomicrobium sp.]|uniref:acrylate utilization transcriptional regulator AcuR n=1 Tax=Hyphomicrobium sp. TaxID=82 RepID=UPI001D87EB20|nr:TetR/AcrR family transcriptional regulator [Hyphomicrobium sp.]MBY0558786.1 TetR/AcrR family transcriptional regulator [Hyphomicrobium sp.]